MDMVDEFDEIQYGRDLPTLYLAAGRDLATQNADTGLRVSNLITYMRVFGLSFEAM